MDALGQLVKAVRRVPPRTANDTETSLAAATATAAIATNVPSNGAGGHFTVTVGVAFNINFGDSGVADPADTASFVAGMYDFFLDSTDTFYKITAHANGQAKSWLSSR